MDQGRIKADYMAKVVDTSRGKKVILKYFGNDKSKIVLEKKESKFLLNKDKNGYYISGFFVYINAFDNIPYLDYVYIPSLSSSKRIFYGKVGTAIDDNKLIATDSIKTNIDKVNSKLSSEDLNTHSEITASNIISDRILILKYINNNKIN